MMSKKKFFDITYSKMTLEQKFDYIKNHFVYNVMNSWNNWESLANNVKIHNLGLTSEQENKFFEIYGDEHACNQLYCFLNDYIDNFDVEHNTRTYYNGRQDGYLATRYKDTQTPIIDDAFYTCSNYLDLVDNFQNWYNYTRREARRDANYLVNTTFEFVQAFDRLCDDIRAELIYILDNVKLKTDNYTIKKEYKYLDFEEVKQC